MDDGPPRGVRRLTVEISAELAEKLADAAELSRTSVDRFVENALAQVLARWDDEFPLPEPPADVRRALDADPEAAAFFATVSRRNHHAILGRIEEAKRPATRVRRIEQAVAMLRQGKTPYRQ
jgi:hypothetical protein